MLPTGKVSAVDAPKLLAQQGHCAYEAKNYTKAEQSFKGAIAAGPVPDDVYARLADAQFRTGKVNEAVTTLQKVINDQAAAGKAVPTDWYARGADMASRAKATPQFVDITTAWLAAYPVKQDWHDSLMIYRQMDNPSADADLDLLRLLRASGAMPLAAQSVYTDYALAVYLKFPNEAVNVLNEGIAAGKLNPTTSQNTREVLAISKPKVAGDAAAVKSAVAASNGAKATYTSVLANADLSYGFGEYKQAADIYTLALAKPGANADLVNLRLGASLAQAGDKAGAKVAFAKVQGGAHKILARYWTVLVDHPVTG
jgi:tetratricopeptide (TPR) repeat protein